MICRLVEISDAETGVVHTSNGRSDQQVKITQLESLYLRAGFSKDNWLVELKPYWRIPENGG